MACVWSEASSLLNSPPPYFCLTRSLKASSTTTHIAGIRQTFSMRSILPPQFRAPALKVKGTRKDVGEAGGGTSRQRISPLGIALACDERRRESRTNHREIGISPV